MLMLESASGKCCQNLSSTRQTGDNHLSANKCLLLYFSFISGKKEQLTQHDLANLSWNIANQYNIPNKLAAQFAQYTFPAWFWNTTTETLAKKLKHRSGDLYIKIDENIIDNNIIPIEY